MSCSLGSNVWRVAALLALTLSLSFVPVLGVGRPSENGNASNQTTRSLTVSAPAGAVVVRGGRGLGVAHGEGHRRCVSLPR